jgi:heme-binding uptake protein ChaN (Tiki superfamily)
MHVLVVHPTAASHVRTQMRVGISPRATTTRGAALFLFASLIACEASPLATDGPTTAVVESASDPKATTSTGPSLEPIIAALDEGRIVALGEWHGQSKEHAFFAEVLRNPLVRTMVDTVVVEFGAAPKQQTADRFVAGDQVTESELRRIWTTTTQQSGVWDSPIYREFFETIRALNAEEGSRKLRVVLGDPGRAVQLCDASSPADDNSCVDRDAFLAAQTAAQFRSGHVPLIVAGVFHVWKPRDAKLTVTERLNAEGIPTYVLLPIGGPMLADETVGTHIADDGPRIIREDWMASVAASMLRGTTTVTCDHPPCGTPDDVGSLKDVADGFVYLGR